MLDKKAEEIRIFDIKEITTLSDYFIICSSNSEPQTRAIINHIEKSLKKDGIKPLNIEGLNKLEWVLMDYMTFIVHVFNKEKRNYYNLDRLWADAKITNIYNKNEK